MSLVCPCEKIYLDEVELRIPSFDTVFLFYYTSIFTILEPLGSGYHELKVNELQRQRTEDHWKVIFARVYKLSSLALGLSCGMRYPVTSDNSPRISSKKQYANYFLIFWIQKMTVLIRPPWKGKISQKCRKINSCLLVSTFTIYLFNSFSFSLLSSPHPYYDFYFTYL